MDTQNISFFGGATRFRFAHPNLPTEKIL